MAVKASDFDHPIVFLIAIFFGIVALFAFSRALFSRLGWTGPLGLFTMGVSGPQAPNGIGGSEA